MRALKLLVLRRKVVFADVAAVLAEYRVGSVRLSSDFDWATPR